jgi:hypothetical protein
VRLFVSEAGFCYVAHVGLELAMQNRLASNSRSSSPSLLSGGEITGMCHYTKINDFFKKIDDSKKVICSHDFISKSPEKILVAVAMTEEACFLLFIKPERHFAFYIDQTPAGNSRGKTLGNG